MTYPSIPPNAIMVPPRSRSLTLRGDSRPVRIVNTDMSLRQTPTPIASRTPSRTISASNGQRDLGILEPRSAGLSEMMRAMQLRFLEEHSRTLESQIETLCQRTADQEAYRRQNEARLSELFNEVNAVKAKVHEVRDQPHASTEDVKKEAQEVIEAFKAEWDQQRRIVREASELLAQLPSPDEVQRLLALSQHSEVKGKETVSQLYPDAQKQKGSSVESAADADIEGRIKETTQSARRWNIEHRFTKLEDPAFIEKYLNAQAFRDKPMAMLIQRHLSKALHRHRGVILSGNATLGEFCRNLAWSDVKATILELTVKERTTTARRLANFKKK